MRIFTTLIGAAAVLSMVASAPRTLAPFAPQEPVKYTLPETQKRVQPVSGVVSPEDAAVRMSKTQESRALQMQLRTVKDTPAATQMRASRAEADDNLELIFEEDFDLFTSGSEDNIDTSVDLSGFILDFENGYCDYNICDVDPAYTHEPGWTGYCIYQAGGACAIYYPGVGGILNTPNNLNLEGVIRVSFRCRAIGDYSCLLFVDPCYGSFANIHSVEGYYWMRTFKPAEGWVDVEFDIDVPYSGNDAFLQFNAMNYDDGVIIDDLKVYRVLDKCTAPIDEYVTKFTSDGFTLGWTGDKNADDYLINLWEVGFDENGSNTSTIDFNDMVYDADGNVSDYNLPEGWEVNLLGPGPQVATNQIDGTDALQINAADDVYTSYSKYPSITTPIGGLVSDFKCQIVVSKENTVIDDWFEYALAPEWLLYGILADGTDEMVSFGLLDAQEGSEFYLDISYLEDYYSTYYASYGYEPGDYTNQYYGFQLMIIPSGDGAVLVDNIEFASAGAVTDAQIYENLAVTGSEYAFTGLNMACDHYYTLQARKGDFVTTLYDRTLAYGLPAPVALPATNVDDRGEFTANWEAVEGATSYYVHLFAQYEAPQPVEGFVILDEDFSGTENTFSSYTIDNPCKFDLYSSTSLDAYTLVPGWVSYGCQIAAGYVGCMSNTDDIQYVATPAINFDNGDGSVDVYVKAYSTPGETLIVNFISSETEVNEYATLKFGADGVAKGTVTLSGVDYGRIYFYNNGSSFMLDEVKVSQDLNAGDVVTINQLIAVVDASLTSCDFSALNLIDGMDFVYTVYTYGYNETYGVRYLSEASNAIKVGFSTSAVESIKTAANQIRVDGRTITSDIEAQLFDLQGRNLGKGTTFSVAAPGVYVVKTAEAVKKVVVK